MWGSSLLYLEACTRFIEDVKVQKAPAFTVLLHQFLDECADAQDTAFLTDLLGGDAEEISLGLSDFVPEMSLCVAAVKFFGQIWKIRNPIPVAPSFTSLALLPFVPIPTIKIADEEFKFSGLGYGYTLHHFNAKTKIVSGS